MFGKYVVFDWPGKGEIPVVFPASVFHHDITASINGKFPGVEPVRAGFVKLRDVYEEVDIEEGPARVRCYGESRTLKLHSDSFIDGLLIETMIRED